MSDPWSRAVAAAHELLSRYGVAAYEVEEALHAAFDALRPQPDVAPEQEPLPIGRQPVTPPAVIAIGFGGESVRRAIMEAGGSFTLKDIATEVNQPVSKVRPYWKALIAGGVIRDTGTKFGATPIFEFVKPEGPTPAREDRLPPEKDRPAYADAPRRGEPVRIRTERKDRKARSTPGARQKVLNTERNWERLQAAKRAREEAAKRRDDTPGYLKKKKGSRPA